jgi:hypothetical protein
MTITDTPRTDAAKPYWDSAERENCVSIEFSRWLERELTISLENQCKAQAEIKEIRNALGDDGRRTHKEILEMAFKASGWKVWKEKYIDLRNAHIAEGQDPAGTIWEHADKLQKELKEAKAEVEKLKGIVKAQQDELEAISFALGTNEGHSSVDHIVTLRAEVERLRDAFSHLANEIECTPKCLSHQADHCDCGRLERAYAISHSIAQNPTK